MTAPILSSQSVEDAIELDVIDRDLYRSRSLWKPTNGRGVFGGQTIGQAAWAATLSVRQDQPDVAKGLHSLHCYFLSFGDASKPIIYAVQRLRDGRSYSTRTVLATQNGVPIFTMTCSFTIPEPQQPTRATGFPAFTRKDHTTKIPFPHEVLPTEARLQKVLTRELPDKLRKLVENEEAERRQSTIEIRNCDKDALGDLLASDRVVTPQVNQACWFRSRAPVRKDPAFQKCVLAYASDLTFIGTAARSLGLGTRTTPRLGMLSSLDHSIHFYDDTVDTNEFNLFWMESPIARSGRGLVQGRMYKEDGTLAVICNQEGVVRAAL